jgi:hypothetical protein
MFYIYVDSKEYKKDLANCSFILHACDWLSWSNNWVNTQGCQLCVCEGGGGCNTPNNF